MVAIMRWLLVFDANIDVDPIAYREGSFDVRTVSHDMQLTQRWPPSQTF
jgi:hypothetical protein